MTNFREISSAEISKLYDAIKKAINNEKFFPPSYSSFVQFPLISKREFSKQYSEIQELLLSSDTDELPTVKVGCMGDVSIDYIEDAYEESVANNMLRSEQVTLWDTYASVKLFVEQLETSIHNSLMISQGLRNNKVIVSPQVEVENNNSAFTLINLNLSLTLQPV